MSQKRALLDVDPSIVEKNLMITGSHGDDLQHLFPTPTDELPCKTVKPTPGFCVKVRTEENDKIFINICQTDAIPAPVDISVEELVDILQTETPADFRIPMSIGNGHTETDKSGNAVTVYDIAINPAFFNKIENSQLFKQFLLTVVFEGLKEKHRIAINVNSFIILKNRKSMGNLQLHRIVQREIDQKMGVKEKKLIEEIDTPTSPLLTGQTKQKKNKDLDDNMKEPPYRLFRMINDDNKQFFIGDFYLPDVVSVKDITLDVGEDRIILESRKRGYLADIFIPQLIEQEKVVAKLNKTNGFLTITMPIVR